MDNNLLTLFSGILTIAGTILSVLFGQIAKKHSTNKSLETLATLATQAVAWAEKNFNSNPEKLKGAIDYVTKEAANLKAKFTPAQIEAQIEASLAKLKNEFKANPVQTVSNVVNTATTDAKKVAEAVKAVAATPAVQSIEAAVPQVKPVVDEAQKVVDTIETAADSLNKLVDPIINGTEGFASE